MGDLPGFQREAAVPARTIEAYRDRLPDELLRIWETQGYGTAVNGFLKIIDPDRYAARLQGCLPSAEMIPIFATGMGDVIVWNGSAIRSVEFRHLTVRGLGNSFTRLSKFIRDDVLLNEFFHWEPYPAAVERLGSLEFDECFGYLPILAIGGAENVENLEKLQIFEHIQMITQLAGVIDY